MWRVTYWDSAAGEMAATYPTKAAAQQFIDLNAMICRLPNCRLVYVSDYREPTLSELQAMRNRIGDHFIAGTITEHEWRWQLALADAMVDRIIYDGPAVTCPR